MPKPSLFWIVSLISPVVIGFIFHVIMSKVDDNDVLSSVYNKVNLKVIDNEIIFNDSISLYKFIPISGGEYTFNYRNSTNGCVLSYTKVISSMLMGEIEVPANLYLLVMQPDSTIKMYNQIFEYFNSHKPHFKYEDAIRFDEKPISTTFDQWLVFIERLSKITGRQFLIPNVYEWYYAAQGGLYSKGFTFAGSDSINNVCWYSGNISEISKIRGGVRACIEDKIYLNMFDVRSKAPNELGLYGMSGGVGEWVTNSRNPNVHHFGDLYKENGSYNVYAVGGSYDMSKEYCMVDVIMLNVMYSNPDIPNGLRLMLEY